MKIKGGLLACAVSLFGIYSASTQATVVIGTYSFEDDQLVSQVISSDGFYDGANLIDPDASPGTITDNDPDTAGITHISTLPSSSVAGYNGGTIDLGFGTSQVNGTGSDLALFFLFDQTGEFNVPPDPPTNPNNITVTINGMDSLIPSSLFRIVVDSGGVQQTANGVQWDDQATDGVVETLDNVLLTVVELELGDFGLNTGDTINSLAITMLQSEEDPFQVASLSLVGSLQVAAVPVPAAVWLFGSGLLGLVGVARRKK